MKSSVKSREPEMVEVAPEMTEVQSVDDSMPDDTHMVEPEPGLTSEGPNSTGHEYGVNEGVSTSGLQGVTAAVPPVLRIGPQVV